MNNHDGIERETAPIQEQFKWGQKLQKSLPTMKSRIAKYIQTFAVLQSIAGACKWLSATVLTF